MKRITDFVVTSCQGKVGFESYVLADAARKRGERNRDRKRCVYRCTVCHKFHLGQSTVQSKSRRRLPVSPEGDL